MINKAAVMLVALVFIAPTVNSFLHHKPLGTLSRTRPSTRNVSSLSMENSRKDLLAGNVDKKILGPLVDTVVKSVDVPEGKAQTGTVNERLMLELEEEKEKEKFGARSKLGKKLGLSSFRSRKTDAERAAAIVAARDLNGVDPFVTVGGGIFALAAAYALWTATNFLAAFFGLHPVESDFYFVERSAAVFRNVAMGLVSLACGFFGVTGLGIFLLGVRVAYGVLKGELDPTPIKKPKSDEVEMPNIWELMTTTKPGRRGKKKDNNPFGF
jgi:Protein of unknown function (DUF3082)